MEEMKKKSGLLQCGCENEHYILVRRQYNDYKAAKYRLNDLTGLHWDKVSGGVKAIAIKYFIFGFVMCNEALEGKVAHSCSHGSYPHSIKVCALKKDNPDIYDILVEKAGPNPNKRLSNPSTGNYCKTDIINLLKENRVMKKNEIISKLVNIGHTEGNAVGVLKKLEKSKLIICEKDPEDKRCNQYRICE